MLTHPDIQALLTELSGWPGPSLKRHNDAGHLLHKLVFISDIGMAAGDPSIKEIVKINVLIVDTLKARMLWHCVIRQRQT
jgi:hypothetical protein